PRRSRRRCPHRLDPRRTQATIHRPPGARVTPAPEQRSPTAARRRRSSAAAGRPCITTADPGSTQPEDPGTANPQPADHRPPGDARRARRNNRSALPPRPRHLLYTQLVIGRRTVDTNDKVELTTAATASDMQASA